ncbi:MAG: transketolase [Planctomycetota bacterium]|nr:MAG: transketolase [Planctomycetota bacterium]
MPPMPIEQTEHQPRPCHERGRQPDPHPAEDAPPIELIANTIRGLAIDAVEAAQSGHPGLPMGMAEAAAVLWTRFLRYDPRRPDWPDRDRFVLSAGHGSMLLYALLHLSGYDLPLEELQRFRQLHSRTPGHPEYGETPGVETTTGPLGQGFANGVGMALAERFLRAVFNRPGHQIVDHWTYGIVSDGDLMEGIASEAASLAGHLGLGRLIYLYDANRVTIDGPTELAFTEDVPARFRAYGWQVIELADGHDPQAVAAAIEQARAETERPSLIVCPTVIGKGSPSWQGTSRIHSDPLGAEEVRRIKEAIGLPPEQSFYVPEAVRRWFAGRLPARAEASAAWDARLARWRQAYPELAVQWDAAWSRTLPPELAARVCDLAGTAEEATRSSSGAVIQLLAATLPTLIGGSADLTGSNKTEIEGSPAHSRAHPEGRNIHYGVREHAMAGIVNGMALHGGVRPYCGTFLVFSDYMRPSIRLAALMGVPSIFVFSHDSVFVGEDGPTHQPVEHLAALRAIPRLHVDRPADRRETAAAWLAALGRRGGPSAIALSRQKVPQLEGTSVEGALRGGYVVRDCEGEPELLLIGTGSELQLCVGAAERLAAEGRRVRVVSLPCLQRFLEQEESWRERVLPRAVRRRLIVEAGVSQPWWRLAGERGRIMAQEDFGASAPWRDLARHFGFTVERVLALARAMLHEE